MRERSTIIWLLSRCHETWTFTHTLARAICAHRNHHEISSLNTQKSLVIIPHVEKKWSLLRVFFFFFPSKMKWNKASAAGCSFAAAKIPIIFIKIHRLRIFFFFFIAGASAVAAIIDVVVVMTLNSPPLSLSVYFQILFIPIFFCSSSIFVCSRMIWYVN